MTFLLYENNVFINIRSSKTDKPWIYYISKEKGKIDKP